VLSDAVAAMRTGQPHSARTQRQAPWGTRFLPQAGAGFHVVLQGSCWLLPAHGEPIHLNTGDVAFLPRELGHAIADTPTTPLVEIATPIGELPVPLAPTPTDGATTLLLCGAYRLDQSRPHPLLAELPDIVHLPARVGRYPALRSAIDLLGYELDTEQLPGASGVLTPLLDMLLLYILRAWYSEQPDHIETGWGAALYDPAVAAALHAIHNDPGKAWTVESLGATARLSRSAFARRFTMMVGIAPLAYLTWWRMTVAARKLRDTDALLRVVAENTGYTSEFAFAKAFKREFGIAPGHYRSAARDQPSRAIVGPDGGTANRTRRSS
jgi:AraC-like DNA-binding protein